MLKLLISRLLLVVLFLSGTPCLAQDTNSFPSWGFNPESGTAAPLNAPFLVYPSLNSELTTERLLAVTSPIAVADGGANGNATISLTTVPINLGGTGQTTAQLGLNALSQLTTKGDIMVRDNTNTTRLGVGTNGYVLQSDSAAATGLSWLDISSLGPATVDYVTMSAQAGLSAERVLTAGTGLSRTDGGANSTVTLAIDSTVATLTGAQTLTNKILTSPQIGSSLILDGTNDITITWSAASARAYTIPDVSDTAFVMGLGNQTIGGNLTITNAPILSSGTLSVGGNTVTIPAAADTLVNLNSAQTLTNKTISQPVIETSMVFDTSGSGNFNHTFASLSSNRGITWRDPNTDGYIAYDAGNGSAGAVAYSDGNIIQYSGVGSSGQVLKSNGTSAPTFGVLGIAGGGTNNGSLAVTAGAIPRGDGTKLAGLALGTANQLIRVNAGATDIEWFTPSFGTVTSFSATPSSVFDVANSTTTPALSMDNQNACTALAGPVLGTSATTPAFRRMDTTDVFGGVSNVRPAPTSGTLTGEYWTAANWSTSGAINCNQCRLHFGGTVTISHAITINTDIPGATGGTSSTGVYSYPGIGGAGLGGGRSRDQGGGGGGYGGVGGNGGNATFSSVGVGGGTYPMAVSLSGSPGAAGGVSSSTTGTAGSGGNGGGSFLLEAVGDITIDADITAAGGTGGNATTSGSGGGGGSGGGIYISSQGNVTINASKTVSAPGGNGGNNANSDGGGGGGGGGGRVTIYGLAVTNNGTVSMTGGTAGTGGTNAGTNGSNGVSDIQSIRYGIRSSN